MKITGISVVIPLYNKEKYIERSIKSVLKQTVQDFELVIVDDGSTDKGPEIVKNFKDMRIKLINQPNSGASSARNRGVLESHFDLIAFLDADDEWKPNFLETILKLRRKYPDAGAYITFFEMHKKKHQIVMPSYKALPSQMQEGLLPSYFLFASSTSMPISTSAICIPKDIFIEVGGFSIEEWMWEDSDLWGRIALKYPIAFSRDICSIYYMNATNRTCNKDSPLKEHPFKKKAIQMIESGRMSTEIIKDLNEYISLLDINFAAQNIRIGNRRKALNILLKTKTSLHKPKRTMLFFSIILPTSIFNVLLNVKNKLML